MRQAPTLFDNPPPGRRRRRPDDDAPPFTRRVKGGAYQARVWLGRGGSLNLGLFTLSDHPGDSKMSDREHARWAAARAAREFWKRWRPGRTVGDVVAELQRAGFVPAAVEVPGKQRDLRPPTEFGPRETAAERRERLRREYLERAYPGGGLLAFAA